MEGVGSGQSQPERGCAAPPGTELWGGGEACREEAWRWGAAWPRSRGKEGGAFQRASFRACVHAGVEGGLALSWLHWRRARVPCSGPSSRIFQVQSAGARLGNTGQALETDTPMREQQPRALRADTPVRPPDLGDKGADPAAPPSAETGQPRLRPFPREPGSQPIGGQQPRASAGANRIPGAAALRGRSQSAARAGLGRARAEIQTGGAGAEQPAGRAMGVGGFWVSVAGGPGRGGGIRAGRARMRGRPALQDADRRVGGGGCSGAGAPGPRQVSQRASDAAPAQGGRRALVLPLPASPLTAESLKEAGWKTVAVDTGRQGPQDGRSGLSILRPPLCL